MTPLQDAELTRLTLGFVPLLDAALPIIAREGGFFAAEGLEVTLSRENAWSTLRDKVAAGLLDGAQMLAPLPLAMSLGLGRAPCDTLAPITLSRNGNTITLSRTLAERCGADYRDAPADSARALGAWLTDHPERRPRLGMVYPFSCQHYQLRQWLALGGIDPDRDVELAVLPPPRMVEAMQAGEIDGFCVGEPWGSLAQHRGGGRIVATGAQLWPDHPEKVLGVTASWAERHPATLAALIRGLTGAADWLGASPEHARQARDWLALPPYLDRAVSHLETLAPDTGPARQRLGGDLRPSPAAMAAMAAHLDQALRARGGRLAPARLSACYSPVHFDAATHQERA
ncbi:CmpA/NrtA family ABC transporter substrate-binding protein [Halomonas cerina]|uniref:ABC-type nitrate/sulfonate/bicarbonate transport system substrate-binding protein n=1 Tax=Halomonas cerina TaxID=447424 RepID=A0A839VB27_9GAMM|nr:CmpA/NrtA family ABC transporter substrate-binding protein [Halomonas cerina]MBB3189696.1 ABC-type nitrate/sulfonate/bicarbonate transport system substrate-binding protein [Halomonas cerina]